MSDSNWFEVTFYRVGESAHKSASETHKAHSLTAFRPHLARETRRGEPAG
jgi:hypothetical protein